MNFKGWEKLEEDAKKVTLRHPQGHTMTIAVKALPKMLQEQLKHLKFAHGGNVDDDEKMRGISEQGRDVRHGQKAKRRGDQDDYEMSKDFAKEEAKGRAQAERKVKPKMKGLAQGGSVHKYADGSDDTVSQDDDQQASDSQTPDKSGSVAPITINVGAPQNQPAQAPQAAQAAQAAQAPQAPQPAQPPKPYAIAPSQSAPTNAIEPDIPKAPEANGSTMQNEARKTIQSTDSGRQGADLQGQVDAARAKATVPALKEAITSEQQVAAQNARAYNDIMQHTQDFQDYINKNPIDPRHYMENMSTGRKVATAIGLALGGFGSAFGGHNYAFDALQKQLDRDLDAQKSNTQNRQNVLGAWQKIYGDNNIATNLAKASLNDILAKKIQLAAAQTGTADAKAKALIYKSKLDTESDALRRQAAVMAGHSRATGQPPPGSKPQTQGGASGNGQGTAPEKQKVLEGSILRPDADKRFANLRYDERSKDLLPEISRQYSQAVQADKALRSVNQTFLNLWKASNEGGWGGRIHRTVNPNAVGAIGAGAGATLGGMAGGFGSVPGAALGATAGEALGHGLQQITNTDANRLYDSEQSNLKGYISAALKGTNIGSGDIDDIVSKNSPEVGDEPRTLAHKLKTIRDFIQNHTETSLLKEWGLAK